MITIENTILKKQKNFWNSCLFHPTDAIEDPWGKRILDRISSDGAIRTVRIYTMFEDIVYTDENGMLCYDFRLSDLRIDYLIEKGFDLLLAYAGIPDCIASSNDDKTSNSKNKTRYKGKLWNASEPRDYTLWEEICYTYTKHLVERYGVETVSKWRLQCFNEPDIHNFFLSGYPSTLENTMKYRLPAYCRLYEAFAKGISCVSDKLQIGGPALAAYYEFLGGFLDYVKEHTLKLDFISVHNYGTHPNLLTSGKKPASVQNNIDIHRRALETVKEHGFGHLPMLVDEWGFSSCGFYNREECPAMMIRETEQFSAYFVKLIHDFISSDFHVDMLCICLSGQHEMTEDFSGFRNFFTMNFFAKPIYNAYILASRLYENLLPYRCDTENVYVIPTRNEQNQYRILLAYSAEHFEETLSPVCETIALPPEARGKTVTLYRIDRNTTNPYRLYEKMGLTPALTDEEIKLLREEGRLKPMDAQIAANTLALELSANSVCMIEIC